MASQETRAKIWASRFVAEAPGPAIATDTENRIVGINRAAVDLLGHDAKRAIGQNLHLLTHARDTFGNRLSGQQFAFFEMVNRSEPVSGFDIEVTKASGQTQRLAVVLGPEAEGRGLVYQLRPIYRRRKADEAIDRILALRGGPIESPLDLRNPERISAGRDLTSRQIQVLRLLARGASAQEAASTLGISVHTVRTHIQKILRQFKVHSQLEAVAAAFRERLI